MAKSIKEADHSKALHLKLLVFLAEDAILKLLLLKLTLIYLTFPSCQFDRKLNFISR